MKAKRQGTRAKTSSRISEKVEAGSNNVFADLGFQDAETRLLKAKLATKIAQLIEKKNLTRLKSLNEQPWTSQKFHDFSAANSLVFQPIDFLPS